MEDFVSFELAKKLKEKGFPQSKDGIVAMYNENGVFHALCATIGEEYWYGDFDKYDFVCPTISQVLKWLREEKKLFVLPNIDDLGWCYSIHYDLYWDGSGSLVRSSYHAKSYFETYEEAALAGVEYVLDNLI